MKEFCRGLNPAVTIISAPIKAIPDPDVSLNDVLFFCGTCFSDDQFENLLKVTIPFLSENSIFILLDKQIPTSASDSWSLLLRCQVAVSWGSAAASVYLRNQ